MFIKLKPKLFDLFQHCELECNANCCGWVAFDFSKDWIERWCEFRDASIVRSARREIHGILDELDGGEPMSQVKIEKFFAPTLTELEENLRAIDSVLDSWQACLDRS